MKLLVDDTLNNWPHTENGYTLRHIFQWTYRVLHVGLVQRYPDGLIIEVVEGVQVVPAGIEAPAVRAVCSRVKTYCWS